LPEPALPPAPAPPSTPAAPPRPAEPPAPDEPLDPPVPVAPAPAFPALPEEPLAPPRPEDPPAAPWPPGGLSFAAHAARLTAKARAKLRCEIRTVLRWAKVAKVKGLSASWCGSCTVPIAFSSIHWRANRLSEDRLFFALPSPIAKHAHWTRSREWHSHAAHPLRGIQRRRFPCG